MFELMIIILLILLNGFFSLSEAAFLSSRKSLLNALSQKGNKRAEKIMKLLDKPDKFLASIQVCITLIGIVSGAYGGIAFSNDMVPYIQKISFLKEHAVSLSLIATVSLITFLSIVIGELVPKTLGMRHPEKQAIISYPIIRLTMFLFAPVIYILSVSTKCVLFIMRIKVSGSESKDPIPEIVSMIRMAAENRELNDEQVKILLNTINMTKIRINDIMIHSKDVKFLKANLSIMDAFLHAHLHHHTRYPLTETDHFQDVIGYVNFKDIINVLHVNPKLPTLKGILRPIINVSGNQKIIDVLPLFMKANQHIAVVVDKKKSTIGLVTLEDIIESLLGDIYDEHDFMPEYVYKISDNVIIVGGGCPIERIREFIDLIGVDEKLRFSDWLLQNINYTTPTTDAKYKFPEFNVTVKKIKGKQIYEAAVEINP